MPRPEDIKRLQFWRMANADDQRSPMLDAKSSLWGYIYTEEDADAARAMGDASVKPGGTYGIWLEPSEVLRYGLTDRMREALNAQAEAGGGPVQRKGISEAREGHSEGTEHAEGPQAPTGPSWETRGSGMGWRWQRVRENVPCPECKGTCEVEVPGTDSGVADCDHCHYTGVVAKITWAIDNRPAIDGWLEAKNEGVELGDKPCPEFQRVVLPDEVVFVIANGVKELGLYDASTR